MSLGDVLNDLTEEKLKTVLWASNQEERELWEEEHVFWEGCFQHMGPKDQYECPIDLVVDRELEKQNELFQLTYLFQISEWTLENNDHDDGDDDGMFDDNVLF